MSVYDLIEQIKAIPGTNDKIDFITKNKNNNELKEFFRLTCDTRIKFHIQQIPEYKAQETSSVSLMDAMESLSSLSSRELTGHKARDFLKGVLESLCESDAKVIERIISKKADCGATKKTLNKVWPKLIRDKSYMRCDLSTPENCANIPFPAILEEKMDGQYSDHYTFVSLDGYYTESREGIVYDFLGTFDEYFITLGAILQDLYPQYNFDEIVFQGELVIIDKNGKVLERGKNNGTIGKAKVSVGTISQEEAESIGATLWDFLPKQNHDDGLWNVKRIDRLTMLERALEVLDSHKVRLVNYEVVQNLQEAFAINSKWQLEGKEGSVLKNPNGIWKTGTSKDQLKMKVNFAGDYRAVGIVEGTGKNKGMMGAVLFESADGLVKGQVGTGWKEKASSSGVEYTRQYIWDNWETEFKDRILVVTGNDLTQAEGQDYWAVSHPRIDLDNGGWRDPSDKSTADTYEKLRKELNSAKYVEENSSDS